MRYHLYRYISHNNTTIRIMQNIVYRARNVSIITSGILERAAAAS